MSEQAPEPTQPMRPAPATPAMQTGLPRIDAAGDGRRNRRGHDYQDRWLYAATPAGAWAAVADGISGGPHGAAAAEAAITAAARTLCASDLGPVVVRCAFREAARAVRPWFHGQEPGGTTLTIATVSAEGVVVATVGDSPAYLDHGAETPGRRPARRAQELVVPGLATLFGADGADLGPPVADGLGV